MATLHDEAFWDGPSQEPLLPKQGRRQRSKPTKTERVETRGRARALQALYAADLRDQARVRDVLDEQCFDVFLFDLPHQLAHAFGRGFALGAHALRGQEGHAVSLGVVAKRVVGCDHFALCHRDDGPLGAYVLVKGLQFGQVSGCIALVDVATGCIDATQAFGDIADKDHGVGYALPSMRVDLTMSMTVRWFFGMLVTFVLVVVVCRSQWLHALADHHMAPFETGGVEQAAHPAFEPQAVGEHDLRLANLSCLRGLGLKHVGVATRSNQQFDRHTFAANLLHQVPQDTEACHGLYGHGCLCMCCMAAHKKAHGAHGGENRVSNRKVHGDSLRIRL